MLDLDDKGPWQEIYRFSSYAGDNFTVKAEWSTLVLTQTLLEKLFLELQLRSKVSCELLK
jgi:hypothetical protein